MATTIYTDPTTGQRKIVANPRGEAAEEAAGLLIKIRDLYSTDKAFALVIVTETGELKSVLYPTNWAGNEFDLIEGVTKLHAWWADGKFNLEQL